MTESRRPSFSPAEWQQNDETELSVKTLAALEGQYLSLPNESGFADHSINMHSPTRAIRRTDVAPSAGPSGFETMPQEHVAAAKLDCQVLARGPDHTETENVGNDGLPDEELDISSLRLRGSRKY